MMWNHFQWPLCVILCSRFRKPPSRKESRAFTISAKLNGCPMRSPMCLANCGNSHQILPALGVSSASKLTPPVDPKDQPFWEVSCTKDGDPERCGLDLSPWAEWLALRVPQSLLYKMTAAEIVAHCVWEMTFYGFTQEKIAAFRAELECSVKEID